MAEHQEKDFWVKVHHSPTGEVIVAVCDRELLGATIKISDGFTVKVAEEFYMGQTASWEQVMNLMESATIINLLGDAAVDRAADSGIIPRDAAVRVGGVKHIQIMR